jgi:hypothetical protein
MNNDLLKENLEAHIRYYDSAGGDPRKTDDARLQRDYANRVLNEYGPKLRDLHFKCKEKAERLLKQLAIVAH